jgi:hypothetical protein
MRHDLPGAGWRVLLATMKTMTITSAPKIRVHLPGLATTLRRASPPEGRRSIH